MHQSIITPVLFFILTMTTPGVMAQAYDADAKSTPDESQSIVDEPSTEDKPLSFSSPNALGEYLDSKLEGYILKIEAFTQNLELKQAMTKQDTQQLSVLEEQFQQQLADSLKVRLYPSGTEAVDFTNAPACGYACIAMIQSANKEPPRAEALLYKTPEANITLVRSIPDDKDKSLGAIVVHLPYSLLKDAVKAMSDTGIYSEIRQSGAGKFQVLFAHGNKQVKEGPAQKFFRIKNARWSIGIWTPGGVAVEEYEAPILPWVHIIIAGVALVLGLLFLVIYRAKRPRKPKAKQVPKSRLEDAPFLNSEALGYQEDDEKKRESTLILGGGAAEVDVGAYLKKEDITDIKKKRK